MVGLLFAVEPVHDVARPGIDHLSVQNKLNNWMQEQLHCSAKLLKLTVVACR